MWVHRSIWYRCATIASIGPPRRRTPEPPRVEPVRTAASSPAAGACRQ
jgi:hypothetical protein